MVLSFVRGMFLVILFCAGNTPIPFSSIFSSSLADTTTFVGVGLVRGCMPTITSRNNCLLASLVKINSAGLRPGVSTVDQFDAQRYDNCFLKSGRSYRNESEIRVSTL